MIAAVPEAFLVEEHIVRRAVREERGIAGLRTFVPHTHCVAVPVEVLAHVTTADEIGRPLPEHGWALLLPRPDAADVSAAAPAEVLRDTWRALFHAAIDAHLMQEARAGRLGRDRILGIVHELGQLPMDEARTVLEEEGLTGVGSDAQRELVELAATWHELARFSPDQLARWFPSLTARPEVEALFDALVPAAAILARTRLEGAPEPAAPASTQTDVSPEDEVGEATRPANPARARALIASARDARAKGHDVAAAIFAYRARRGLPDEAATAETTALASLGRRLGEVERAIGGDEGSDQLGPRGAQAVTIPTPDDWAAAIAPLLPRARWGMARVEARLLHDLQKACDTAERETWDIDFGRWLRSLGRKALRRREDVRTEVAIVRSLTRALKRVALCRLDEAERRRLKRLLGTLAHRAEERFRVRIAALLDRGLTAAALVPTSTVERVAHDKLIAELSDKLLARGFIGFPDLRDQIAKNQLKLPDLRSPGEWLSGDALLSLDRWCAANMDAAYVRGEIYRRGLQRLSSLFFANVVGRLLVRYAILPFGGAFFIVQGLEHMIGPLIKLVHTPPPLPAGEHHYYFWSIPAFLATGLVLFMLIHSAAARHAALSATRAVGRALRFVFTELPRRFRAWPPIDRLVRTRLFELFWNRAFRPARYALVPTLVVVMATGDPRMWLWVGAPLVLAVGFFLASRRGIRFSEALGDWLTTTWHYLRHELVPGLIAWIMAFFKRFMELAEIALYTVDQWLRFRRGDRLFGVILKGIFGFLWGIVAYIVRLMVNLVVEPQVNPIKHFPVVTVSHKLTIPMTFAIAYELRPYLGRGAADLVGGLAQFIIPGICGFLVWEFKENWRLYQANRKPNLHPVIVGTHGEPIYRLLRLGFHSGTVPRIFRKLRNAEKKRNAVEIRKQIEELHHIEEACERFVERELKRLLERSGRFPDAHHLHVEAVRLTPFRIAIDLGCAPRGEPLQLTFEEQSRFLVAGLARRGFLDALAPDERAAFTTALEGLYRLAGVDLVREQIEALLPTGPDGRARYDIDDRGLVVWPAGFSAEIVYRLRTPDALLTPRITGEAALVAPVLATSDLFFKRNAMPWSTWTAHWQPEPADATATAAPPRNTARAPATTPS